MTCAEKIIPLLDPDIDVFGLGGFCILGQHRKLLPLFFEIMAIVVALLKRAKIKRVHIWGVCLAEALGPLLFHCDHYHRSDGLWGWDEENCIEVSTDSIGPSTRIVKEISSKPGFSAWGYSSWFNNNYPLPRIYDSCKSLDSDGNKAPTCNPSLPCRGQERARHVQSTADWLAHFRIHETSYYRAVNHVPLHSYFQPTLFEELEHA